jgi:hypothetical protein
MKRCAGCGKKTSIEHRFACARLALVDELDRVLASVPPFATGFYPGETKVTINVARMQQLRANILLDDQIEDERTRREVARAFP